MRRLCLILTLFSLLLPMASHAAEPLFIGQARVDVMGEDPEDARDIAVKQAKRAALEDLFTKFAPSQKSILIENLDEKTINNIVKEVKFTNELVDGNRLRADAKVSVSAGEFNKIVTAQAEAIENDDELITTASLILPLFESQNKLYLFEDKNLWGNEWKQVARNVGRGQLITPFCDSVDYSMLNARDTLKSEYADFAPLIRRYGVRDIIILYAKIIRSDMVSDDLTVPTVSTKPMILEITERRVQAYQKEIKSFEYVADTNESESELLLRAARDLSAYLLKMQRETVDNVAERKRDTQSIMVVVPITTMQHFTWLRERLVKVAGVESLDVLAIKPRQADMRINFTGDPTILVDAIKTAGMHVEANENFLEIRP